ncbi:sterol desaturase family protein [Sedimentitalea sp. XS_ASV28]|uniref:sterol desaturase family protein n=1 Tax=Sedimentitalea sp. XS_ASV28 TaxID=3241296 RepID=UPI003517D795
MTKQCPIDHLAGIFSGVLATDLLRYAIGAGGVYLVVNIALAARLRARKIRAEKPPGSQIHREILTSLRTVLVFALNGTLIVLGAETGMVPIYTEIATYGWTYLILSTAVLIVAHDAWFYWSHRLFHYPPLFRRFHRLHHRSYNPTPFTSYSFDLGEAVANAIYLPLILLVLPAHPVAILIFVTHMMLRNAIGHSGYELFPANRHGRPLFDWMTTVTHHDLHHAHAGYNLGLYFTWWDRLMGTEHPDYHEAFGRVAKPVSWQSVRAVMLAFAIIAGFGLSDARAERLSGAYASPGLGIIVRFEPCGANPDLTCGRMVWAWDPAEVPHARQGNLIVTNLHRDEDGWSGQLKNPKTGASIVAR